ncbi:unnamed protein product [Ambrosiozyma monospora]|uniref:Unnamed protein product n=1 Tax=Ambrosiozyma monospora TaxID=43982 RepID=A0ACB5TNM9_AMBMO|nr:unnamed protein product [Ambrosiozyma monospora]
MTSTQPQTPQLQQITLPLHRLNQRLVYLPGVTYKTVFDYDHGLKLLGRMAPFLKLKFDSEAETDDTTPYDGNYDGNANAKAESGSGVGKLIRSVFGYNDPNTNTDDEEENKDESSLHDGKGIKDDKTRARQLTSRVIQSIKLINSTFQLSDKENVMKESKERKKGL